MFSQGIRTPKLQHGLIFVARADSLWKGTIHAETKCRENCYCEEASERL